MYAIGGSNGQYLKTSSVGSPFAVFFLSRSALGFRCRLSTGHAIGWQVATSVTLLNAQKIVRRAVLVKAVLPRNIVLIELPFRFLRTSSTAINGTGTNKRQQQDAGTQ
eukprot:INCI16068.6.p2 GENE.INCI16068.6~~INCI16068.6.p2  ORF type:complete len:108 (+),score=12.66 INCI16068.6:463-786(+)